MSKKNYQNQVVYELEQNEFTVYLEVYGTKGKMIAKLFEDFETDDRNLTREMLSNIEEFMMANSGIKEEIISHTEMIIREYNKKNTI